MVEMRGKQGTAERQRLLLYPHEESRGTQWMAHMAAGEEALQQGRSAEAERRLGAALQETKGFGPRARAKLLAAAHCPPPGATAGGEAGVRQ